MIFSHWLDWIAAFAILLGVLSIMLGVTEWWKYRG